MSCLFPKEEVGHSNAVSLAAQIVLRKIFCVLSVLFPGLSEAADSCRLPDSAISFCEPRFAAIRVLLVKVDDQVSGRCLSWHQRSPTE